RRLRDAPCAARPAGPLVGTTRLGGMWGRWATAPAAGLRAGLGVDVDGGVEAELGGGGAAGGDHDEEVGFGGDEVSRAVGLADAQLRQPVQRQPRGAPLLLLGELLGDVGDGGLEALAADGGEGGGGADVVGVDPGVVPEGEDALADGEVGGGGGGGPGGVVIEGVDERGELGDDRAELGGELARGEVAVGGGLLLGGAGADGAGEDVVGGAVDVGGDVANLPALAARGGGPLGVVEAGDQLGEELPLVEGAAQHLLPGQHHGVPPLGPVPVWAC